MFDSTKDSGAGARQAAFDINSFHGNLEASVNPYNAVTLNALLDGAVSNLIGATLMGSPKDVSYWVGYVSEVQYVINEYDFNNIKTADRKVVPTPPSR